MRKQEQERQEEIERLKSMLAKGQTVYTVLRHVSPSGMSRLIDVFAIKNDEPLRLTWAVSRALGWTYSTRKEALRVDGCGMDMGFHVVHCLARVLFDGDGYALNHRWL